MLGVEVVTIASPCFFFCSSAHCSTAPSTCRKLLMHAFFCAEVRALTKFGIAIAAKQADDRDHDHDFHEGETQRGL